MGNPFNVIDFFYILSWFGVQFLLNVIDFFYISCCISDEEEEEIKTDIKGLDEEMQKIEDEEEEAAEEEENKEEGDEEKKKEGGDGDTKEGDGTTRKGRDTGVVRGGRRACATGAN